MKHLKNHQQIEPEPVHTEREAFEVHFKGKANFERNAHHPDFYLHLPTRTMWGAWQARANLPTPTAPQDAVSVLEAWEAIGHDTGYNPSKDELLASLRYMAELATAQTAPQSGQSGMVNIRRDLLEQIDESAICDGSECSIDAELFLELCAALSKQGSAGV